MNNDDWISTCVNSSGSWEIHIRDILKTLIQPNDVVVDAGAHVGIHSRTMDNFGATVHSFEPISYNRTLLKRNVPTAIIHPEALADRQCVTCINYSVHNPFRSGTNSGDHHIGIGTYEITTTTLDQFELSPSLIKLDVQGAELMTLQGAENTIRRSRPYLIVEIEQVQLQHFGLDSSQVFKKIRDLGYEIFFIESEYPSDHLCVPYSKMEYFMAEYTDIIKPHTTNNHINNNLVNGVTRSVNFTLLH